MKTAMKKLFSLVLVAILLVGVMPFQASADGVPYYQIISPSENNKPLSKATGLNDGQTYNLSDFTIPSGYEFDYAANNGNPINFPFTAKNGDVIHLYANPVVNTHTHSYAEAITTEPTCTAAGVKTFTCSCGDSYTEEIAVLGHTEVTDAAVDATCTATGLTEGKHCSVCNEVFTAQEVVPALGHNFVNGECDNCQLCYTCKVDPCTCVKTEYTVTFNVNKDGSNNSFSRTYKDGTTITLDAALVSEETFGDATVEWIVNGSHKATNSTVTVDGNMTISCSITNKETKIETIDLNANGGRLPSYVSDEYTVVIGQPYGNLPEPTRDGHEFAYWYYLDKNDNEVRVYNSTTVKNDSDLYAKWIANGVTVTFQRYDMIEGWVTVDADTVTVPVYSELSVEDGTFPSNSRVDLIYDLDGFNIKGWKIAETGKSFKKNDTEVTQNITLRPRYKGTVKLEAQDPVTGDSWKTNTAEVEIGEPIGELMNPGPRSTFIFDGWVAKNGAGEICDRFCVSSVKYYPSLGTTFNVKWEGGVTVNLHIHVNGKTATADKIVPYYVAPAEGVFDMKVIDMDSIYAPYGFYDDDCDKIYGWYDSEEWKNYCANRAAHPATSYRDIQAHGQYDFHIMLIDNGSDYHNSSSSSNADSSNPKTGDMIFTTVTVMGASAACLAVLFYLNKKRAF